MEDLDDLMVIWALFPLDFMNLLIYIFCIGNLSGSTRCNVLHLAKLPNCPFYSTTTYSVPISPPNFSPIFSSPPLSSYQAPIPAAGECLRPPHHLQSITLTSGSRSWSSLTTTNACSDHRSFVVPSRCQKLYSNHIWHWRVRQWTWSWTPPVSTTNAVAIAAGNPPRFFDRHYSS